MSLSPAEIIGLQIIDITKSVMNEQHINIDHSKMDIYEEWIEMTWTLYLQNEIMLSKSDYRTLCLLETLDISESYYFALICSIRHRNILKEGERVLCRTLISKNPFHTNMLNNINQQTYNGDVICYIGPYINTNEADHATQLSSSRKIEGKMNAMIEIAKNEHKTLMWVMIPPTIFSKENVCTMFLPDTIHDSDH